MENQIKQIPIFEMAKKKRHIYLLEKMAKGKSGSPTLSKAELKELAEFECNPNSPGMVDSQEKVAKGFGVAVRTVERWVKDGMPAMRDGRYNLADIQEWRFNKKKIKEGAAKDKGSKWEDQFREFKARLAEIEYKKKMGELLSREEVEHNEVQRVIAVKRSLLMLPRSLPPQLVGLEPRQIQLILLDRVKEICNNFAGYRIGKK